VLQALPELHAQTLPRDEVIALLPKIKVLFQTPGLANIYDSAAYGIPTLFLPPANDSQGQQLRMIQAFDQVDECLDWHQIGNGDPIDYHNEQPVVLERIAYARPFSG